MVAEPHRIRALARVNDYFRKALNANPSYPAAVALRDRAQQARDELPAVQRPDPPGTEDDLGAWLDAVAEADAAERARTAKIVALTQLLGRCDGDISMCVLGDPDGVLESLSRDFEALMKDVDAAVQRLGGARTPTEVIVNNASEAWNELGVLRQSYDALRVAQSAVMASAAPHMVQASKSLHLDDPLASDVMIANLDDVFPTCRQSQSRNLDGTLIDLRPWPVDDYIAELVWLSSSEARPWIPTLAQLEELHADRIARANPMPNVIPGRQDILNRTPPKQAYKHIIPAEIH
ncbi:MAG: hypothetical protein QOH91_1613 [Mycobacterium sp.]|jgi:hypothetical protein|nr:hypothetical protein [Mycobacterium sp.]